MMIKILASVNCLKQKYNPAEKLGNSELDFGNLIT